MSRITTAYYGADPTTQFAWATAGTDQFSRTQDLYYLAQALENHDHTNGRGLPVGRINDGIITAASYAPLSVGTAALANLGVTNAKLAAGSVSLDKLAMPLREATSDAAGGLQLRDAGNTYTSYWWTSANGFQVFSATTVARLMIDQGNHVVVGGQFPATVALFNIFQTGVTIADGFRLTHPSNDAWRLSMYHDNSAQLWITTPTTAVILGDSVASFYPGQDNTVSLGNGSFRWSGVYAITATIGTAALTTVTMSTLSGTSISITGGLFVGGAITGPTSITATALAVTSLTTSTISATGNITTSASVTGLGVTATGTLTGAHLDITGGGSINTGTISATGAANVGSLEANTGTVHGGDLNINQTGYFGTTLRVAYGSAPPWNITLGSGDAGKPGGGSWQAVSDPRSKYKDSIRAYEAGLDVALALEPIWFRYNGKYGMPDDGQEYVGFDASALKALVPSMVREIEAHEYPPDETNPYPHEIVDPHVILSVDPTELPFIAIRAIQQLHDIIQELEHRVQSFEDHAAQQ